MMPDESSEAEAMPDPPSPPPPPKMTATEFVRAHPTLPPSAIVAKARAAGLTMSDALPSVVRIADKKRAKQAKPSGPKPSERGEITAFIRARQDMSAAAIVSAAQKRGLTIKQRTVSRILRAFRLRGAEQAKPVHPPQRKSGKGKPKPIRGDGTKTAFIRSQPLSIRNIDVVRAAKKKGINIDPGTVSNIRFLMRQQKELGQKIGKDRVIEARAFIRRQDPSMSAPDIVKAGRAAGYNFPVQSVYNVRHYDRSREGKAGEHTAMVVHRTDEQERQEIERQFVLDRPQLRPAEIKAQAAAFGIVINLTRIYGIRNVAQKAGRKAPQAAARLSRAPNGASPYRRLEVLAEEHEAKAAALRLAIAELKEDKRKLSGHG